MTKPKRFCLVDGCVSDAVDGGVCPFHGATGPGPKCVVQGCDEDRYARDLCNSHYEKMRRDAEARLTKGRVSSRPRTPEETVAFEPHLGSVEIVGASPAGTTILVPDGADLRAIRAVVDTDARRIAQLLWNHIGAASFAGLEPFTLRPRNSGVTP